MQTFKESCEKQLICTIIRQQLIMIFLKTILVLILCSMSFVLAVAVAVSARCKSMIMY